MNKLKKALVMVLALAMVLTCAMVTPVQAAGKLNKKSVSIYETETVSLTVKGVKSVTWKTSDKKIATVDKKGLVKGVKKGTCTVTAKDTKTKAAYSCKVTVKAAKSLGIAAKDISVFTGGETISYPGEEIKGATYVLDGKKLGKKDYSTWTDKDGERVVSYVTLATVYKGNIIKNLIMDCQSYTKYRPNETTGGIFVSWRRKEELPTGA